jgi:LPS sulfotransferase NodH
MSEIKFAIVGAQRSGSTWIQSSLNSHPQIACAPEIFHPKYDREHSYYVRSMNLSKFNQILNKKSIVYELLDSMYHGQSYAQGFKFMYSQARLIPYKFPMVMKYFKQKDIRIIHVVRENSLRICISREMAKSTGLYHTTYNFNDKNVRPIKVSVQTILKNINKIEKQKRLWRNRLSNYVSIELIYEHFVNDKLEQTKHMLNFLEVDSEITLSSALKKVISVPITQAVKNYSELESALISEGYDGFL